MGVFVGTTSFLEKFLCRPASQVFIKNLFRVDEWFHDFQISEKYGFVSNSRDLPSKKNKATETATTCFLVEGFLSRQNQMEPSGQVRRTGGGPCCSDAVEQRQGLSRGEKLCQQLGSLRRGRCPTLSNFFQHAPCQLRWGGA